MRRLTAGLCGAVLLLLGVACAGSGSSGPISPGVCEPTSAHRVGATATVEAVPAESSIRGLLVNGATAASGQPFEVRWVMDARKAGQTLRMRAVREGTGQVLDQTWSGSVSGQLAEFPARITFPAPGCWSADLSSGTAGGSVVFKVT